MIYQIDHPGIPLETNSQQNLAQDESMLQGFFLKSDLRDLLMQVDCVGIRFYNVDAIRVEDRRMIAVGVASDGSELNQPATRARYLLSAPAASGAAADKLVRSVAKSTIEDTEVNGVARSDIFFASFFSRDMIENLLTPTPEENAIDGIRFYVTTQQEGLPGSITHCGISAVLDDAGTKVAEASAFILSDRPCPGFCVNADPQPEENTDGLESMNRISLPAGVAAFPGSDSGKYLVIW